MPSLADFEQQPPAAPLNEAGQQALADFLKTYSSQKRLAEKLASAVKRLTESVGQLNDAAYAEERVYAKRKAIRERDGEEEDGKTRDEYEEFQRRVKEVTEKMDHGIRSIIDDQDWLENVPVALEGVATRTGAIAEATQRQTQGPTPIRTQRAAAEDDEDEESVASESVHSREIPAPKPEEAPTTLLQSAFKEHAAKWKAMSLTARYSGTNEYTGFYKTLFDARHPGENAPPLPHSSLWFAEEENPDSLPPGTQPSHRRHAEDGDDSDVEVAAERISLKCPITFLTFKDPVTTTKCPHTFEKEAILGMLRASSRRVLKPAEEIALKERKLSQREEEAFRRENGVWGIACPVCSWPLLENELRPDQVMVRKVKRAETKAERAREAQAVDDIGDDEEEEDDAPRGSQGKPFGLGSSPASRRSSGMVLKKEWDRSTSKSVVPATQNDGDEIDAEEDSEMYDE